MKRTLLALCIVLMLASCGKQKVVTYYDDSDQVESIAYLKNGLRDGEYQEYYPSGILKRKSIYIHGLLNGPMDTYDKEGLLVEASGWLHGKREGYARRYSKEGKVYMSDFYRGGIPCQERIIYYANGQVRSQTRLDSLGNKIYYMLWDEHGKKEASLATPVIKISRDTLSSLDESAFVRVSFGYKLKGSLDIALEGMDTMKEPSIEYKYDSINVTYSLAMRFSEPGLHKMMLDVFHKPEPGDTLSANGGAQEIRIFIKSPGAI
jgi:antitoxin component YwqK of YwqJK toxin-antitoxin module